MALRWISQANMDLGILQETNIADIIYIYGSSGYSVVTMNAPSRHCSGVAVFYQASLGFEIEAIQKFVPNVVSFHLAVGERLWYIIRCYLAPDDALEI